MRIVRPARLFLAATSVAVLLALSQVVNPSLPAGENSLTKENADTDGAWPLSPGPGYNDTSEFLIGRVAVGVFLVESEGPGFDWRDSEINEVLDAVRSALEWWASLEPRARLSFQVEPHIRVGVTVEPVRESLYDDGFWINEILSDQGYTEAGPWFQVRHYNNDLRTRLGTDWAYSMFIAKGDTGSFANGGYGHGHYGGPWLTIVYASARSDAGWLVSRFAAHETGHIFYATDEYNGATETSGYLDCPDSEGFDGIMGPNLTLAISDGTRCQVGWVDADGNGVLDILDLPPQTSASLIPPSGPDCQIRYEGTATVTPRPNRNPQGFQNSITISRISVVEYRVDGADWTPARPLDGAFDRFNESFRIATSLLAPGAHTVEIRSKSSEGISDTTPIADTMTTHAPFCSAVDALPSAIDRASFPIAAVSLGSVSSVLLWYASEGEPARPYAEDDEPPWEWTFDARGAAGEGNYSFFSVAVDAFGKEEPTPPLPDSNTTVSWLVPDGDWSNLIWVLGTVVIIAAGFVLGVKLLRRQRN